MAEKVAVLLDGGFVTKLLKRHLKAAPTADHIESFAAALLAHPYAKSYDLYRAFYYDCPPLGRTIQNPISNTSINLGASAVAARQRALLTEIELKPNFSVRRGELLCHGWRLRKSAISALKKGPLTIAANHIEPHLQQKGVDQKITLDLVSLVVRHAPVFGCDGQFDYKHFR